VFVKRPTDGSNVTIENIDGVDLVREVTAEVLEGGDVIKGIMRLVPAGSDEPTDVRMSPGDEGQLPTPNVPSSGGKLDDGALSVPVAWANLWTTNHRVELWV